MPISSYTAECSLIAMDHATKHGSLATLGALSYLALLIITGAVIATSRSTAKVPITRSIVSNE